MNTPGNTGNISCKVKLDIPVKEINTILKELSRSYEVAGVINCNHSDKISGYTQNKGNNDSVSTPNHVINYHTHPINAYNEGETVWGWPSGEDIRETVLFGLAGNKAHIVFTVEGIYVIQVSSCKLKKMKTLLTNEERGVLIFLIEEYFKTTHNFRCFEDVNNLGDNGINITPHEYIKFINNFDIRNVLKNSKNTSGTIPNNGFPELSGHKIKTVGLEDYVSESDLNNIRTINPEGEYSINTKKMNITKVKTILKQVLKKFDIPCKSQWNGKPNSWFFVNFFETDYYTNKMYLDNDNNCIPPDNNSNTMRLVNISSNRNNPYIKIFSSNSEGCSFTEIARINNFSVSVKKSKNSSHRRKNNTTFGNSTITPQQRYWLYYTLYLYPNENDVNVILENMYSIITKNKIKIDYLTPEMITSELNTQLNNTQLNNTH